MVPAVGPCHAPSSRFDDGSSGQTTGWWPAALRDAGAAASTAAARGQLPNCSSIAGPTCHDPRGDALKCNACVGPDLCGCPGATSGCKPCYKCEQCSEGPNAPTPPPVPQPAAPLAGGLLARGPRPSEMKPVQWLRVAAAWLLRAATICSTDGRNISLLTPGFPVSASHASPPPPSFPLGAL
jgi:hypothetical protein